MRARAAVLALLFACRTEQTLVTPDPHLERMLVQEKLLPYGESPVLPNGMAMQKPPHGSVPMNAFLGEPLVEYGAAGGAWADRVPLRVDRAIVLRGQRDFNTFCATCHGALGDGVSVVASKMALCKPPSLLAPQYRAYPPGRIYQTIREGYGLMPSYARQLSIAQSWGLVAYVAALQLARGVRVEDLPPEARAELSKEAP